MKINLELKSKKEALKAYLNLLYSFHKLTDKEVDVLVELIIAYQAYLLKYKNEEVAVKLYLEASSRDSITAALGMKRQVFRNYLTALKAKKALDSNKTISKVLMPEDVESTLSITINFKYAKK